MRSGKGADTHEWFRELCGLSVAGNLSALEAAELESHLRECESCRELLGEYRVVATDGMAMLAESYREEHEWKWDAKRAAQRLLERVRAFERTPQMLSLGGGIRPHGGAPPHNIATWLVPLTIAAGLVLSAAGYGGYWYGSKRQTSAAVVSDAGINTDQFQKLVAEKAAADALLAAQADQLASLQKQSNEKERELVQLRQNLRAAQDRAEAQAAASGKSGEELRAALQERDALNAQLVAATQGYDKDRADLVKLRTERDGTLIRTSSLESRINELTATNRDQERRLKETEQYLSSDRDIRELMGARKLYIADVFDVDGSSQTQRPFGRVFYTQGKSLIFYAFDLDHQPKVVNASAFQVWGQRETPQGEQAVPMNLGILYMDSEANRRWVMRFDDPKQLAEIDAVFVTVEPHGGSSKPTSKPFLYALLRNQANHP